MLVLRVVRLSHQLRRGGIQQPLGAESVHRHRQVGVLDAQLVVGVQEAVDRREEHQVDGLTRLPADTQRHGHPVVPRSDHRVIIRPRMQNELAVHLRRPVQHPQILRVKYRHL